MTSPAAQFEIHVADGIGPNQPITGAFMTSAPTPASGRPPRGALMTFAVSDADAAHAEALTAAGAEALPPTGFPHVGRVAFCEDGEGNVVGMVQPAGGA